MSIDVTQRDATRNQSSADYQLKKLAIWNNSFIEGDYKNTTGSTAVLQSGMLVARSLTIVDGFIPVTFTDISTNNLADTIGIAFVEGSISQANNAINHINIISSGGVDGNLLVLPAGVTLDTVVGNKVLKDVLNVIGIDVDFSTTELTKFDN